MLEDECVKLHIQARLQVTVRAPHFPTMQVSLIPCLASQVQLGSNERGRSIKMSRYRLAEDILERASEFLRVLEASKMEGTSDTTDVLCAVSAMQTTSPYLMRRSKAAV